MLEQIVEKYSDEDILKADGFDDAVIGVCEQFDSPPRLVYSVSKCLDILMEEMDEMEAMEYFDYNVSGAYVGESTPVWCWDLEY